MKRVIVLNWFKKIVNRLFNEDEYEHDESTSYETTTNEKETDNERKQVRDTEKAKPAFRFPIITDAEIYGWDESIEELEPKSPPKEELDDHFEPIPLYENERWPGRNEPPSNIYRAGDSVKYGEKPQLENRAPYIESDEELEEYLPPKDEVPRERVSGRFTPSAVVSPIHGFSNPMKNASGRQRSMFSNPRPRRGKVAVSNELEQEVQPSEEVEKSIKVTSEKAEEKIEKETVLENAIELTNFQTEAELETSQACADQEMAVATMTELEEVTTVAQMDMKLESEDEPSVDANVGVDVVENAVERREQGESDEVEGVADHTQLPLDDSDVELLEAELESEESTNFEEDTKIESPFEAPKTEKEKVVPFNVLMLKSDKEKLAKSRKKAEQLMTAFEKTEQNVEQDIEKIEKHSDLAASEMEDGQKEKHYVFPSLEFLLPPEAQIEDGEWLESQSEKLEESLSHFGVQATVIDAVQGPTVTRFEFTVGQGTKVSRVRNLTDDLKLALAAQEIRIQAPIPGRSSIGIEIPNRQTRPVRISEVIGTEEFSSSKSPLEAVLGLSLTGKPVTLDLRKMPHGMIAGATGSGKSVCINSILISLLYKADPSDLKMMLIDPKMVELAPFNGIPHLISPVITDVKAATAALKWAVTEMERRYELLAHAGVRDIDRYNKLITEEGKHSLKMPYLLIVIDELSDLMMVAPSDVEVSISRIAQKARACGIHLIIATQRPSVDVITGTIKANIPTRIAFSVSSQVDSRTIIDTTGAERLLGKGDMLYIGNGQSAAVRLQGTFVTDDEIERIIEHVQHEASPTYLFGQDELLKSAVEEEEADPLFEEACQFVFEQGSASTSLLQRNFSIGYNRAAKLMDRMEKRGFISEQRGSRPRDVFLTESDLDQLTNRL